MSHNLLRRNIKERLLTQTRVRQLLSYDKGTGVFKWKESRGGRYAYSLAGRVTSYGYVVIKINSHQYMAHRIAFLYVTGDWPEKQIDHINRKKLDNKWINLRHVSEVENHRNVSKSIRNKSGIVGVHHHSRSNRWVARIGQKTLGYFRYKKHAVSARKLAEKQEGYVNDS